MAKKTIVISGINMKEGGLFTILDNCLQKISDYSKTKDITVIALVCDENLFNYPDIKFIAFPKAKKSWIARLYYEYIYFNKLSKTIKPDVWLSLHDVSPNVKAKKRFVYFHHPTLFYKSSFKDWKFDYKIGVFSLLYKHLTRINIKKNNAVFVQQNWIKNEFEKYYKIQNIKVCYPEIVTNTNTITPPLDTTKIQFFYPLVARSFKNVEIIAEAIQLLPDSINNKIQVSLTFAKGDSKYGDYIIDKYTSIPFQFLGKLSREEVFSYYKSMDCLLFPSKLETWGLPLSEAKSFGKPILSANLPYAKETIGNYEMVSFFNTENPRELADFISQFVLKTIQFQGNKNTFENSNQLNDWNSIFEYLFKD